MPARDMYHHQVITALVDDGWVITDDPLRISFGGQNLYVDIGAEQSSVTIGASKANRKIAVEIKSFVSNSAMHDLEQAVGQYDIYRAVLSTSESDRELFLAVSASTYDTVFSDRFGQLILSTSKLRLMVFDPNTKRITQWIN